MNRFLWGVAAVTAGSGCVHHRWVAGPEAAEAHVQEDLYACMRENTHYEWSSARFRSGSAVASGGHQVSKALAAQCMRARGYTWVADADPEAPLARVVRSVTRPAERGPWVLTADLGVGSSFAREGHVLTKAPPDGLERVSFEAEAGGVLPSVAVGAAWTPPAGPELGLVVGGRPSVAQYQHQSTQGGDAFRTQPAHVAPFVGLDARLRVPGLRRLSASGGVGLAYVPALDAEVWTLPTGTGSKWEMVAPGHRAGVVPSVRLGVALDLAHAEPVGWTVGFGVEQAFGGGIPAATIQLGGRFAPGGR